MRCVAGKSCVPLKENASGSEGFPASVCVWQVAQLAPPRALAWASCGNRAGGISPERCGAMRSMPVAGGAALAFPWVAWLTAGCNASSNSAALQQARVKRRKQKNDVCMWQPQQVSRETLNYSVWQRCFPVAWKELLKHQAFFVIHFSKYRLLRCCKPHHNRRNEDWHSFNKKYIYAIYSIYVFFTLLANKIKGMVWKARVIVKKKTMPTGKKRASPPKHFTRCLNGITSHAGIRYCCKSTSPWAMFSP